MLTHPELVEASTISNNLTSASNPGGAAFADGGGIFNDSLLDLDETLVRRNNANAEAASGKAQGGGIFNGEDLSGPPVELALHSSAVTANSVTGSPGIELHGGGIFTEFPGAALGNAHPSEFAGRLRWMLRERQSVLRRRSQ